MANDLVKRASSALGTVDNDPLSKDVGGALVLGGLGTLAIGTLASMIPFVGPVLLAIIFILGGGLLWLKGASSRS